MRIAIIQGAFLPIPPSMGGAVEKMWFALGKDFAKKGHEVVHISRKIDDFPEQENIDQVHHIRIKGYDTPKSGFILKLLDLIYTIRARKLFLTDYDIVVSNTFWSPIIFRKKVRQICMVDVQRMPKGQMRFYTNSARLRANSTSVADAIREEISTAFHNKVVMIPNPLPFSPSLLIDFKEKKPIILYVGRIHPEKGLSLLIEAYKLTSRKFCLQLVGPWEIASGGGGITYINSLRQLAGDSTVEFIEPIFDIELLNQYYKNASIFVYPSIAEKGETFGLAPLEAMAWGCTPIVSNLACFRDFIIPEENGLIFDHSSPNSIQQLAKHITHLQDDYEFREKLGMKALNVRQTHSISHIADLFLKEFKKILKQSSRHDDNTTTNL